MKKLRILWLHPALYLSGGGTRYVCEAIQELSKQHTVELYVQKALPKYIKEFENVGIHVNILSKYSTGDFLFWINFKNQIKREIKFLKTIEKNFDIVISSMFPMNVLANSLNLPHLQSCFQPYAFFWDPNMVSKLPFSKKLIVKFLKFIYGKYDLSATKKSDKISTVINDIQFWIEQVYGCKSFVNPVGVNTDFFKHVVDLELEKKYAGKKIILHSTDWTPLKRTSWLVEQFGLLQSEIKDSTLLILEANQQGTERDRVIKKIKEANISNVELCGFIPENKLPAYYSIADVTVYCGIGDGAGSASYIVLESMACETPVIRTNLTHDEVEHEKTGFLFNPDDAVSFQKFLKQLLNDPNMASKFGKSGREFVIKHRSWKNFVTTWEKHFDELLK
jgi:glycosyltransferase involved in cell wall biosynthesis